MFKTVKHMQTNSEKNSEHETGKSNWNGFWRRNTDGALLKVATCKVYKPDNTLEAEILFEDNVISYRGFELLNIQATPEDQILAWTDRKTGSSIFWIKVPNFVPQNMWHAFVGVDEVLREIKSLGTDLNKTMSTKAEANEIMFRDTEDALFEFRNHVSNTLHMLNDKIDRALDKMNMTSEVKELQKSIERIQGILIEKPGYPVRLPEERVQQSERRARRESVPYHTPEHHFLQTPIREAEVSPPVETAINNPTQLDYKISHEKQLKMLNQITFPKLTDVDFLYQHLERFEGSLATHEISHNGVIAEKIESEICNKLLDSVSGKDKVAKVCRNIFQVSGNKWLPLKKGLMRAFCSRETMIEIYRRRMEKLRFKSIWESFEFIADAKTIYSLMYPLYASRELSELRIFINTVIMRLPEEIRKGVVTRLTQHRRGDEDWETCIPFMQDETCDDSPNICNLIEMECHMIRSIKDAHSERQHSERQHSERPNPDRPHPERRMTDKKLDTKEKEKETEYFISGPGCSDVEKCTAALTELAFTRIRSRASKQDGSKFFFALNKTDLAITDTAEKLKTSLGQEVQIAQARRPKNL